MDIISSSVSFWVTYGKKHGTEALESLMDDCAEAMICGRPIEVSYEGARGRVEYSGEAANCAVEIAEAIRRLGGGRPASASNIDLSCKAART